MHSATLMSDEAPLLQRNIAVQVLVARAGATEVVKLRSVSCGMFRFATLSLSLSLSLAAHLIPVVLPSGVLGLRTCLLETSSQ